MSRTLKQKSGSEQARPEEKYGRVFSMLQDKPWAIHPAKLEEINAFVQARLEAKTVDVSQFADAQPQNKEKKLYQMIGGTAVIPVTDTLAKRMNLFMSFSGGTSMESLQKSIRTAAADPLVSSILLDIDSPGGTIDGVQETSRAVAEAARKKPVIAYVDGMMASAAYWIGSAASAIVSIDTGLVGSIGVALTHYDFSAQDEKAGVKRTVLSAGKYKRIASDEKPLSQEGRDYLQEIIDTYYTLFVDAVAKNRGVSSEQVIEKMADGKDFIGAQALAAGLVDYIGSFDTALKIAGQAAQGAPAKQITVKEDITMDRKELKEQFPELFQEVFDLGAASVDQGKIAADATAAERARVVSILGSDAGADAQKQAVETGLSLDASYKLFFEAEKKRKDDALLKMAASAPPAQGQVETVVQTAAAATPEEKAKKDWDADADLRAEFGGKFETYLAFVKADSRGLVKMKKARE